MSADAFKPTPLPACTIAAQSPSQAALDVLVLPVQANSGRPALLPGTIALDEATTTVLLDTAHTLGASGRQGQLTLQPAPADVKASAVLTVGVGTWSTESSQDPQQLERLRRSIGGALRQSTQHRRVGILVPNLGREVLDAVVTAALLGSYHYGTYRNADPKAEPGTAKAKPVLSKISFFVEPASGKTKKDAPAELTLAQARTILKQSQAVAQAVALARDLANTPPNHLAPAGLADAATAMARPLGIKVKVFKEDELARRGFGGILGVGQGSQQPPRLIRLEYSPARVAKKTPTLALVGKGITFDSGGLSLKPAQAMETMKADMSGAAAAFAAITAIATLKLPLKVTVWLAAAENMPSGSATRPGDVLKMYNGTTVEVLNTDAEGRLVLADALSRAQEDKPDVLLNAATLTGAAMVALGPTMAGVMANQPDLANSITQSSREVGEEMWAMPLAADLRPQLDSKVADIKNIGTRYGGMLTAGLFLEHFINAGQHWAHLDIAGPAFNENAANGYTPSGGTGAAVRTFVKVAQSLADGSLVLPEVSKK